MCVCVCVGGGGGGRGGACLSKSKCAKVSKITPTNLKLEHPMINF